MRKLLTLVIMVIGVYSCSHKVTPAAPVAATTPPVDSVHTVTATVEDATMVANGKLVYEAKCGKCHGLVAPEKFTKERWVGLVNWMAPKAKTTDEEKAEVLAYVQHNAKDAVK